MTPILSFRTNLEQGILHSARIINQIGRKIETGVGEKKSLELLERAICITYLVVFLQLRRLVR